MGASTSLGLNLMDTGTNTGTWGDVTNVNLGTLLEQAITGYIAIAKSDNTAYTLSNTDYVSNQTRNAIIEFTGTPGGAFNVIVPLVEKLWVFKNSTTNGAMTVKGASGSGVTVATGTSRWLYCDGTNVLDALTGTLATQSAASVAITGGTITGLSSLTLASGAATPATNDAAALGTSSLMWSDLYLASTGTIDWNNNDVRITHAANSLAFSGASLGYTFDAFISPATNDGAALGSTAVSWSDLFMATGAVVNIANGNWVATHTSGILTVGTGDLRVTTAGTNTASVVTVGGTQTLSAKTLDTPTVTNYTETLYAPAANTAYTVSLANGTVQKLTSSGNLTVTLPSSVSGKSYVIIIAYGGTHTLSWTGGSTIKWSGGTAPTPTSTSGKFDIFSFFCDGTNTYGQAIGLGY